MVESRLTEKQVRFLAAYVLRAISSHQDYIAAATYPDTPLKDFSYRYFNNILDISQQIMDGVEPKEIIQRMKAIDNGEKR